MTHSQVVKDLTSNSRLVLTPSLVFKLMRRTRVATLFYISDHLYFFIARTHTPSTNARKQKVNIKNLFEYRHLFTHEQGTDTHRDSPRITLKHGKHTGIFLHICLLNLKGFNQQNSKGDLSMYVQFKLYDDLLYR